MNQVSKEHLGKIFPIIFND